MPFHHPTMLALAAIAWTATAAAQVCSGPLPAVSATATSAATAMANANASASASANANANASASASASANASANASASASANLAAAATIPATAPNARYRLITQQCPGLAEPGEARAAEQLLMFDRATTVTLTLAGAPEQATLAMAALPPNRTPLPRDAQRIVALAPGMADAARAHGLDPLLLHAIAHVESRHNPQAVSPAGARGLMQVMPATAQRFGVADAERTLHDAGTNLRASAALLRTLHKRYGADLRLVLAAYNAGEGAVSKYGNDVPPYPETQAYVRDVSAIYRRLRGEFKVTPGGELLALKKEG
jgi:soluble lytic murein transglycosylase-like protein